MKTLAEVLRAADPLGDEPPWDARGRHRSRQIIVNTPRGVVQLPRRMVRVTTIAALTLVATVAIGSHFWSRAVEAAVRFEVRLAEEKPAGGLSEATIVGSDRKVYLHREVIVRNSDIAEAQVVQGDTPSTFSVSVVFSSGGAMKMMQATQNHIGRPLAILVDGEVVIAPVVRSPISSAAVVTGNYMKAEAERIVAGIRGQ